MQFLANENFPLLSIRILRNEGHDIVSVLEDTPGIKDREVLLHAQREARIVLTFDRDYGELVYRHRYSVPGIVYFRFDPITPEEPAKQLQKLLNISKVELFDKFTVIERGNIRQRSLHK